MKATCHFYRLYDAEKALNITQQESVEKLKLGEIVIGPPPHFPGEGQYISLNKGQYFVHDTKATDTLFDEFMGGKTIEIK